MALDGPSSLGSVVGAVPCLAPPAPLLGSGGESLLISMCVASLIAQTLLLCSKMLLSISLQYQLFQSHFGGNGELIWVQ